MAGDRPRNLQPQRESLLDVLMVNTVDGAGLHPEVHDVARDTVPYLVQPGNEHLHRPVHGTMTVDVRDQSDRRLLERLLNGGRVLSITAADGWSQRVRLTALRRVDTEVQADGRHAVVATYTWVAAAAFN